MDAWIRPQDYVMSELYIEGHNVSIKQSGSNGMYVVTLDNANYEFVKQSDAMKEYDRLVTALKTHVLSNTNSHAENEYQLSTPCIGEGIAILHMVSEPSASKFQKDLDRINKTEQYKDSERAMVNHTCEVATEAARRFIKDISRDFSDKNISADAIERYIRKNL